MPRTVFILGAGASYPYGFPLGEKLVQEIIEKLHVTTFRENEPIIMNDKQLVGILLTKFQFEHIKSFREALIKASTYSIDSFLANREDYRQIGKMCIAYILLSYENKSISGDKIFSTGDWYKLFWNNINSYIKSDVFDFSIYTFNYERSLEYYIYTAFKNLHNATDEYIKKYFENLPVTHLHGNLGNLEFLEAGNSVPY